MFDGSKRGVKPAVLRVGIGESQGSIGVKRRLLSLANPSVELDNWLSKEI